MNTIAEKFVTLGLAFGKYDQDYVDAYFGPKRLHPTTKFSLEKIIEEAQQLLNSITKIEESSIEIENLRKQFLEKQILALQTRAKIVHGEKLSFNTEAKLLYDAIVPSWDDEYFLKIQSELENLVPGTGFLSDRMDKFIQQFIIPKEKVDEVFKAAIQEARERTKKHFQLPSNENFVISYVNDEAWSGYNWFQGNAQSLIEVNVDLPIYIDRAIDLASHEGYPGHHVYHTLQETNLLKDRKWVEFSLNALFSPSGFISEGSANYGIEVAFPKPQRMEFEKEVLCPILDWSDAELEEYYKINHLRSGLKYGTIEIARRYLDEKMNDIALYEWANKHTLTTKKRFQQSLRFINKYRSYVVNYSLGFDLIREYIISHGGTENNPEKRWELFQQVLANPTTPSSLR